jgi:hypothetical protein
MEVRLLRLLCVCDELITLSQKSYGVCVCDLETSTIGGLDPICAVVPQKSLYFYIEIFSTLS